MTRGRAVLATVAVVVLGIGALSFVLSRSDGGSHPAARPVATPTPRTSSPGSHALVSSLFADIILRHPASWRSYESEQGPLSSGPGQLIGYLTDQAVDSPECSITATTTQCHSLVEHLAPGGIVVTIFTTEDNPPIKGATRIAGHPATLTRSEAGNCADNQTVGTYEVVASIQTSAPTRSERSVNSTVVDACVADPVSAQTRLSIERMLKTARL